MSEIQMRTKEEQEKLLDCFSVLDENTLLYKHLSSQTPAFYQQTFLVARSLLLKNGCQLLLCKMPTILSDFPDFETSVKKFLPMLASMLKCMAFILPEPEKWEELRFVLEKTEINLDCKVIVVRSQEEALSIFHDMDGDDD